MFRDRRRSESSQDGPEEELQDQCETIEGTGYIISQLTLLSCSDDIFIKTVRQVPMREEGGTRSDFDGLRMVIGAGGADGAQHAYVFRFGEGT